MKLLTAILIFLQASCFSVAGLANGMEVYNDLAYYEGPDAHPLKHKLNLVLPGEHKNVPILVWLHGGAWAFGGRTLEMDLSHKFAGRGIAVAAVSYRLSPAAYSSPPKLNGVQHPAHIEDVASAFKWLYDHAGEYGYDRDNMFISGAFDMPKYYEVIEDFYDEAYAQAHLFGV